MRRPLTKWIVRALCVAALCGAAATLYPGAVRAVPLEPRDMWGFPHGDPVDDEIPRREAMSSPTTHAIEAAVRSAPGLPLGLLHYHDVSVKLNWLSRLP